MKKKLTGPGRQDYAFRAKCHAEHVKAFMAMKKATTADLFTALADAATMLGTASAPFSTGIYRAIRLVDFAWTCSVLEPQMEDVLKAGLDRLERDLLNAGPKKGGTQ